VLTKDSVLNTVCFAGCSACVLNSIEQVQHEISAALFPNPTKDHAMLSFTDNESYDVTLFDVSGQTVKSWTLVRNQLQIDCKDLGAGMYFVIVGNKNWAGTRAIKFIVE
jgi:hypothetical protein